MCKNCQGRFFCARIAQGVWNFLPGAAVLAEHSTEPRGRVAAADAAASAGTSKSEEPTETVPSGVRRVPVGLHEGPPVRRFFFLFFSVSAFCFNVFFVCLFFVVFLSVLYLCKLQRAGLLRPYRRPNNTETK